MQPTQDRARSHEEVVREEKIALLRQYPPVPRAPGMQPPTRLRGSGEILIRSHDPDPSINDFDEGDRTLPRGILNTGDPELLRLYKELYGDTLRAMPDGHLYVEYLDQRIQGLERIRQQREESRQRTERGEVPALPQVQEANGTILLTGVRQTAFQTATQGCWSVALANILQSRGVPISQEEIRAFRPTMTFQQGHALRAYDTNDMNNDAGSDPYHDSELVMDNIPNTAVRHWGFEDLPPAEVDEKGNVYRDFTDDTAVAAIRKQVEYALKHDQSPIAIKYCGHYQTIVGIRGNQLLLKDSLTLTTVDEQGNYHVPDPNTTYGVDLYEIVSKTRTLPEGYQRDLSLMWLSELHKDPLTDQVEELKDYPDLQVAENGKLNLTQAENADMLTVEGHADIECGQTAPSEKEHLRPYFKTKFPKEIRKNLLKPSAEPSRSVTEHLTIPQAVRSPETLNRTVMAKLPGYEEIAPKTGFTETGLTEEEELNLAIQASLETRREELLAIREKLDQRQANKTGAQTPVQKPQVTAQPSTQKTDTVTTDTVTAETTGRENAGKGLLLLSQKQEEYLQNPKQLEELAALFDTKKHLRIVNWNSGAYNDAKRALDDLMAERVSFLSYVVANNGQPGFDEAVEQRIRTLNGKEELLRARLDAYVRKVTKAKGNASGTKGVEDMTQSAGAARLTGAKGILNYLGGAEGRVLTERERQEQVTETSFADVYRKEYERARKAGESNVHRRAAKKAQTEIKKKPPQMGAKP